MTHVTYRIVQHDEGWAYKAGDVFSEPFPTHAAALAAAKRAAQEQRVPGQTHVIEYEDEKADGTRKRRPEATARIPTSRTSTADPLLGGRRTAPCRCWDVQALGEQA
jgi:hypothetical protein